MMQNEKEFFLKKNSSLTKQITVNYIVELKEQNESTIIEFLIGILNKKLEEKYDQPLYYLYDSKCHVYSKQTGKSVVVTFQIDFLDHKLVDEEKIKMEIYQLFIQIINDKEIVKDDLEFLKESKINRYQAVNSQKNQVIIRKLYDLLEKNNPTHTKWEDYLNVITEIDINKLEKTMEKIKKAPNFIGYYAKEEIVDFKFPLNEEKITFSTNEYDDTYEEKHLNFADEQVTIILVYKITNQFSKASKQVFNAVFGGTSFSQLFKNVRELNQMCYTVHSSLTEDYLFVNLGVNQNKVKTAIDLVDLEIEKISLINEETLQLTKDYLENQIIRTQNEYNFQHNLLLNYLKNEGTLKVDDLLKKITEVKLEDLKEIAQSLQKIKLITTKEES